MNMIMMYLYGCGLYNILGLLYGQAMTYVHMARFE